MGFSALGNGLGFWGGFGFRENTSQKPLEIAHKAILLHTFGVQVGFRVSPGALGTFGICRGYAGIAGATLEDAQGVSLRSPLIKGLYGVTMGYIGIIRGYNELYRDYIRLYWVIYQEYIWV